MLVELSILPVSQEEHVGKYVAEAVRIVDASGLNYKLTPMGTLIEGEWGPVMKVVKSCHAKVMEMTDRAVTKIRIDDFRGEDKSMDEKVKSVEEILAKKLKK